MPTWPVVAKLGEALDGDVESIRLLWMDAQKPLEFPGIADDSEIQVFVSYARIDDQATYGRISKLIEDIANTYQSMTGWTVGVFSDVDSIKPGDDWRDRIRLGLSYSSIFLAFISPAYLRSANCREELNEFLAFLISSSADRLVIPLMYAKKERIETSFAGDELWAKICQREYVDISRLRSVNPGSTEWIETIEFLADSIDERLSSFKHIDDPVPTDTRRPAVKSLQDTTPPGTLERMATLEEKVPQVVADMSSISDLLNGLAEELTNATPRLSKANTFAARLAVSRDLAKRLRSHC